MPFCKTLSERTAGVGFLGLVVKEVGNSSTATKVLIPRLLHENVKLIYIEVLITNKITLTHGDKMKRSDATYEKYVKLRLCNQCATNMT